MLENPSVKNIKISFKLITKNLLEKIKKTLNINVIFYHNFVVLRDIFVYVIFHSGFVNCTKIPDKTSCRTAIQHLKKILNIKANLKYKIDNLTASGKFEKKIFLPAIRKYFLENKYYVSFHPNQFAGASVKVKRATIILFFSGSYCIVGAKKVHQIHKIFEFIKEKLVFLNYGFLSASID